MITRNAQAQILEQVDSISDQTPVFISNYPLFLNDPYPITPVYQWGLSHSFQFPFTQKELIVYPILNIRSQVFKRALLSSDIPKYHFFKWKKDTKRSENILTRISVEEHHFPQTEIIVSPLKKEIEYPEYEAMDSTSFFEDLGFTKYELYLFTALQPYIIKLTKPETNNMVTWQWPEALLTEATSKSNQDEVFWMVGAKNKEGKNRG